MRLSPQDSHSQPSPRSYDLADLGRFCRVNIVTLHCLRLLPRLGKGDSLGSSTETLAQVMITVTTELLCRITITSGVPEGTLRIGVVVGHRCISVVLATMSTLVVGVKVVAPLVIVQIGSSNPCYTRVTHEPFFSFNLFPQN